MSTASRQTKIREIISNKKNEYAYSSAWNGYGFWPWRFYNNMIEKAAVVNSVTCMQSNISIRYESKYTDKYNFLLFINMIRFDTFYR